MIAQICDADSCMGCAKCEAICPKKAISINIKDGFYRPVISEECVSCGICIKKCPANNREEQKYNPSPSAAYAAWCKDNDIHLRSTSGGLAYKIGCEFIKNGGAVAAVWFNQDTMRVEHRLYEDSESLKCMRGSRYVQSNKSGIYRSVSDMLNRKDVLFIGVPCEVAALQQFIDADRFSHRLYCIDILCHGGASPQCFAEHIEIVSHKKSIVDVSFRGGDYDCNFVVWGKQRKKLYRVGQFDDPYFLMFMKRSIYQPACYDCMYVGNRRVGDITLGDFWGLDNDIERKTNIQGINLLFVNNDAGQGLIKTIEDDIEIYSRPIHEAINGNDTLREATHKPKEYDDLWLNIKKDGFHKAVKKVYGIDWRKSAINWRFKLVKSKIKKILYYH